MEEELLSPVDLIPFTAVTPMLTGVRLDAVLTLATRQTDSFVFGTEHTVCVRFDDPFDRNAFVNLHDHILRWGNSILTRLI